MSIRTDLAMEMRDFVSKGEIDGVISGEKEMDEGIVVTHVEITDAIGSRTMGKPVGHYTNIEAKKIKNAGPEFFKYLGQVLCGELKKYLPEKEEYTTLVVGLGNRGITADALGSRTVEKLLITRHLKGAISDEICDALSSVCAITPSVLGVTGIESAQIVKSIAEQVKPEVIIVIDSLASRGIDKIGCTFQITDTGIAPGSGVGNTRDALNSEALGCRVIALGVPMVVYSSTIVHDIVEKLVDKGEMDESSIRAVIEHRDMDMVVTPKEIDDMISGVSTILAKGINLSLHPNADEDLIEQLMF